MIEICMESSFCQSEVVTKLWRMELWPCRRALAAWVVGGVEEAGSSGRFCRN